MYVYLYPHLMFVRGCLLFSKKYVPLNMTSFVGSQSFISLPSFVFVSAPVSELREWNQNKKKNSEIDHLRPFLGV